LFADSEAPIISQATEFFQWVLPALQPEVLQFEDGKGAMDKESMSMVL